MLSQLLVFMNMRLLIRLLKFMKTLIDSFLLFSLFKIYFIQSRLVKQLLIL